MFFVFAFVCLFVLFCLVCFLFVCLFFFGGGGVLYFAEIISVT